MGRLFSERKQKCPKRLEVKAAHCESPWFRLTAVIYFGQEVRTGLSVVFSEVNMLWALSHLVSLPLIPHETDNMKHEIII